MTAELALSDGFNWSQLAGRVRDNLLDLTGIGGVLIQRREAAPTFLMFIPI